MRSNHSLSSKPGARAADAIIKDLRNRIVSNEFDDGATLPSERELIEHYGASRTVIREVITTLSSSGLIENKPRFRPTIRKPGYEAAFGAIAGVVDHLLGAPNGIKNLYESRIFIECALAREAATNGRKEDMVDLEAALERNIETVPDAIQFSASDMDFHGVLYLIPRNPIFPAIHRAYFSWLEPHWSKLPRHPERNKVNYRNHEEIFEAIRSRDADGAEEAMKNHLKAAWEYLRLTMDEK